MTHPAPPTDVPSAGTPAGSTPAPGPGAGRPRGVRRAPAAWRGVAELRADLGSAAGVVLSLMLAGVPAGLLWWALAPRADFRITATGPVPVGMPSPELLVADDAVLALILAGAGLLAGAAAWFLRRRRGVAMVLALALGGALTGIVAWQVGELLGAGPTESELADVGAVVTTSLTLGSLPALALAPVTALIVYVAAVLHAPDDGLGRTEPEPAAPAGSALS
ncbi:LPXTG cell wall anchor domain-containing protein [Blastococcus tunisiensis]|uniref:LPXTG cell wall anchor domain-containing protein n=1 Tax=Blastococcus tunisiensis TaxID=1798228 RepID=UPI001113D893|nr:LPXTG cell wall anchor domain-containing protein [Blastococcus sp. DSM 46838]